MDSDDAKLYIQRRTAADQDPTLEEDDLNDLVGLAKRTDSVGLPPTDDDWTPTWDLNYAIAAGWDIKAGRCANRFRFRMEDQQDFDRAQIFEHCQAMAKRYRRGATWVPINDPGAPVVGP